MCKIIISFVGRLQLGKVRKETARRIKVPPESGWSCGKRAKNAKYDDCVDYDLSRRIKIPSLRYGHCNTRYHIAWLEQIETAKPGDEIGEAR